MRCRVRFLLNTYLWTVLVFVLAKVAFMLACREGHAFTAGDVLDVVLHGLTLDLSTALYFLIVPFLVAAVSVWWPHRALAILLRTYFVLVSVAFALAFVADTSLYPFWGFKLNALCLQYLSTPSEAMASVTGGYLFWRLIALVVVTVIIFWGYKALPYKEAYHKLGETVLYILLIPLMIIGIRGGVDESTTNVGQVYYSQDQFLNHSAVNPVFSFLASLGHQMGDTEQYQFMDEAECERLLANVYTTESVGTDTLLTTDRPNVVIILLESCGEIFAEAMPRLQQLKQEGIWFSQCYGNSWRTDRGTVCILSGYPSFPLVSVMKMPEKSHTLPSIARTLQDEGYTTHYLYGGDINFTNMRSYLISTGWEKLTWKADYSVEEQNTAKWGVRDDITFRTLYDLIMQGQGRSLIGYSTLSSHEPWDVPTHTLEDEKMNAFAYLDTCIGNFVDSLKTTPQWRNLLIVFVADHGINYKDIDEQQPLRRNQIPMLWIGGAVKAPRTIDVLCNQTDLAATLLAQMGLPHDDFSFSRDVFSKTYRYPTAVHNYNNAQLLVDSTGYILYDFDARRITVSQGPEPERLSRLNQAILQQTTNDLSNR